jgi:uncharacterized RmlC-like cupin family protein
VSDAITERFRERDPEPPGAYDRFIERQQARLKRAHSGQIVMRRDQVAAENSRQGILRWYLNSQEDPEDPTAASAIQNWDVFVHDIRRHSGMHRHQGGLVIYVIRGRGYTLVEGERVDWKAGDLLLLPVIPGGVAHQHFNEEPGTPAEWVAFVYRPMHDAIGSYIEQMSEAPNFVG